MRQGRASASGGASIEQEERRMSQENVDLVRGGYEAFGRQDIPGVLERFDANIEWTAPDTLPNGGTHHGPDGVAGFFGTLPETWAELRVEPEEYLDAGDTVVVLGTHRARGHNGVTADAGWVHVWDVKGGKVVRFRETADTAKLLPALEKQPA
jgi:ketosteroid isomerase-like protein